MKYLICTLSLLFSLSSFAAYEPFKMSCLVNPAERNEDNLRSISFMANPDSADNQYVAIKGVNKKETGEYEDTFVNSSLDQLDQNARFAVDQIVTKNRINLKEIFSITEFVLSSGGFHGYKISSKNGDLGKALFVMGTVIHCKD